LLEGLSKQEEEKQNKFSRERLFKNIIGEFINKVLVWDTEII
jgi:hypothetical protein